MPVPEIGVKEGVLVELKNIPVSAIYAELLNRLDTLLAFLTI